MPPTHRPLTVCRSEGARGVGVDSCSDRDVLEVDLAGDVAVTTVDTGDEVERRTRDGSTDERGEPEQPQLPRSPVAVEERDGRGAGRVDRGVRDRDGDEVDEGQAQADGQGREPHGRVVVGHAKDDVDEKHRQQDLRAQHGHEGVAAGGVLAVAVGGHVAGRIEDVATAGDGPQGRAGEEATQDLGDDVARHVLPLEPLRDGHTDRHRRVEVSPRDVPQRVGHRYDCETEGESHAQETNAEVHGRPSPQGGGGHEAGREDRAPTPSEDQPERADELGNEALGQLRRVHAAHCGARPRRGGCCDTADR